MQTVRDLSWWRTRADAQLSPIEEEKKRLRRTCKILDREYPGWIGRHQADPGDYPTHDARRAFFVTLMVVLQNAQLTYTFMRDQVCDPNWWQTTVGKYEQRSAHAALREQALMAKFFIVHGSAMAAEETLRSIVRAGSDFSVPDTEPLQSIYRHVLKVTSQQDFEGLFELVRLVRNTIHTNGFYAPRNGKDATVAYGGREFEFTVGERIPWIDEEFTRWLVRGLHDAMAKVVHTQAVTKIPHCPRGG